MRIFPHIHIYKYLFQGNFYRHYSTLMSGEIFELSSLNDALDKLRAQASKQVKNL